MKNIFIVIGFLALFLNTAIAQQTPIAYGETITAFLETGDTDTYIFPGEMGDGVIIKFVSINNPNIDPNIELRDGTNGQILASIDVINNEARLPTTILNTSGNFIIRVFDNNGEDSGNYCISLQKVNIPPINTPLVCGEIENGTLNCGTEMSAYLIGVTANTTISFVGNIANPNGDPKIEVYGSDATLLGVMEMTNNQAVLEVSFVEDDCITIIMMENNGGHSNQTGLGDFTIQASLIVGSCSPALCDASPVCGNGQNCQDPTCAVTNPTASTNSPLTEGQTLQLMAAASDGEMYNWTGPNGFGSTEQNPSITGTMPSDSGQYCVTISNANGCTVEECVTITINAIPPMNDVTLIAGEVEGSTGQSIMIPIYLQGCDILSSIQGTIEAVIPGIIQMTGTASGQIDVSTFNPNTGGFSWFDMNGGQAINPNDPLFFLTINLIGNPGGMTNIIFTNNATPIEISCIENGEQVLIDEIFFTDGKVTISNNVNIQGIIETCGNDPQPVFLSTAQLNGVALDGSIIEEIVNTGMTNTYLFSNVPSGGQATINVEKDINYNNGLSTFWLYAINQMIVDNPPPPFITHPCQVIAADVNCSNSVTAADLFIIQQVIVGLTDDFPDNCPSWKFIPKSHIFPSPFTLTNVFPFPESVELNPLTSDTTINFWAIKMGDIGNNNNPQQLLSADDRTENAMVFHFPNRHYEAGELVELNFTPRDFETLVSLQFAFQFDHENLEFLQSESALSNLLIGDTKAEIGKLRMAWFSSNNEGTQVHKNASIGKVIFRAKNNLNGLEDLFNLVENTVSSEAITNDFVWKNIEFIFDKKTAANGIVLHQNVPNPFRHATLIIFDLPEPTMTNFLVRNHLGQTIFEQEKVFTKGQNLIEFEKSTFPAGLYFYTLKTANQSLTKTMIISQ